MNNTLIIKNKNIICTTCYSQGADQGRLGGVGRRPAPAAPTAADRPPASRPQHTATPTRVCPFLLILKYVF